MTTPSVSSHSTQNASRMTFPQTLSTIIIENVEPEVGGARYPIKREIGDRLEVSADVFKEGHDVLAVVLRYRTEQDEDWRETPMQHIDNDRWLGRFDLTKNLRYHYTVAAYVETFASWRQEVLKKRQGLRGKRTLASELLEGQALLRTTLARATGEDKVRLAEALDRWKSSEDHDAVLELALSEELAELVRRHEERLAWTVYDRELTVVVDRITARFAAWYEMFPRSQGTQRGRPATFKDCEARLPAIQAMGFDVLYLPPIHPIGRTNRKGPNNSLQAGPNDPGSPYAIGNEWGGHDAIDPELGTFEDFDRFVRAVEEHGMELALDFAINCSPDHPYVKQHPEWFYHRPDGTIKYAENPPKRYEDIYPLNFYCSDWRNLWQEMKRIILFWVGHGVRIFRVDNPHTKPVAFWRWLIEEVQHAHPDVLFLSEAFTRPKMMRALAKAGFSQSYTYFTWRNFKEELTTYMTELTQSEMKEYFRSNFFTNTPDILPEILQHGGRPAFKFRLVLAATLSPSYGIYNGYELCENRAIAGTEEYLDSEKYQHKVWDWDRRGNIIEYIAAINQIRRDNPALQEYENIRFWECDNDHILYYGKATLDRTNSILIAVNLNPFQVQECRLQIPLSEFGIGANEVYQLHDLITDQRQLVKGPSLPIRLDPQAEPAVIFAVRRWSHREQKFDYFM
jgi:starch synthase (maltosyl-transferring)